MENQSPNQNSQIPPQNPQTSTFDINQTPQNINPIPPPVLSKKKSPVGLIIGIVLFLLIAGGVAAGFLFKDKIANLVSKPELVTCTMELEICPDGSYVGRSGPKCELAPCPVSNKPPFQSQAVCESTTKEKCSLNMCQVAEGFDTENWDCKSGFYPKSYMSNPINFWKTYTNNNLGFSIKHPSEYKIDETSGSVVLYKGEKIKTPPNSPIDPYPQETSISILDRGLSCGDCESFKLQETKIASYRAQKNLDISHRNDVYVYTTTNTRVFRIGYGFDPELGQILSTFKFVE